MYRVLNKPILPRIKLLEESLSQSKNIYYLDWSYKEKILKEEFDKRIGLIRDGIQYTEVFPAEYNDWLHGLRFQLNENYLEEIEHESKIGIEEWNRHRGLDTAVREYMLQGAIQHFANAFYLLADCVCDDTGKWIRKNRDLAFSAMLYKFWEGQTGRGRVAYHSQFQRIESLTSEDEFVSTFVKLIRTNEEKREEDYYNHIAETFNEGGDDDSSDISG